MTSINNNRFCFFLAAMAFLAGMGETIAQPATSAPEYAATIADSPTPVAPQIELPDLSQYTLASIQQQLPANDSGKCVVVSGDDQKCLSEFFGGKLRKSFAAMQASPEPKIILIQDGAVTLAELVKQIGDTQIAEQADGAVTLRLPLLVGPNATLVIQKQTLRLATKQGVFLANQGTLHLLESEITSWDEETKQPSPCDDGGERFRPFVTSFFGSKTYAAGSTFRHLGYLATSSYGFSLTSHPNRNKPEASDSWPTGTLVDNVFEGLFYGFYSFEARDVAIVGNKYTDNIRYGIDPHDRSTRLTIAKNFVTGTKEKHGIIGSRGVTDSFIFDNDSRKNKGTGIMLDRQCSNIVIANNRVVDNEDTGIALFESSNNQVIDNAIGFNGGNGFRVRNSQGLLLHGNQIVGNQGFAIASESKQLADHEKRIAKGDTYEPKTEMSVFSNALVANIDGMFKGRSVNSLKVSNVLFNVDMDKFTARIGGEERELDLEDDDPLGGDLEEFLVEFDKVIGSKDRILSIQMK